MTNAAPRPVLRANAPTLRGALHCHTTGSDGVRDPDEVVAAYGEAGYDFVVLTDHYESAFGWHVTEPPGSGRPLAIRGLELSTGAWADPSTVWVNAVGVPEGFEGSRQPLDACRELAAAGAYLTVIHPGLNQQTATDLPVLDYVDAVEVFTQSLIGLWPDQARGSYYADALLTAGRRILLNAADDSHFFHPRDRFVGRVEVQAETLSAEAIVAALKAGDYYSSTGPRIHSLEVSDEQVTISCDPCYAIACTSSGPRWGSAQRSIVAPDVVAAVPLGAEAVTINKPPDRLSNDAVVVSFDTSDYRGSFFRLTLIDAAGGQAWTNPIWP